MTDLAGRLRTLVLQLVIGVVVLDAAAIAIFLLTPVRHSTGHGRMAFLVAWTVATLAIVLPGLHRIRAARTAARRAAAGREMPGRP